MTSEDIHTLHGQLSKLIGALSKNAVAGTKEQHTTNALREAVDGAQVALLQRQLEHAYGIIAMKGALSGSSG